MDGDGDDPARLTSLPDGAAPVGAATDAAGNAAAAGTDGAADSGRPTTRSESESSQSWFRVVGWESSPLSELSGFNRPILGTRPGAILPLSGAGDGNGAGPAVDARVDGSGADIDDAPRREPVRFVEVAGLGGDGFMLHDVLSSKECADLIKATETMGSVEPPASRLPPTPPTPSPSPSTHRCRYAHTHLCTRPHALMPLSPPRIRAMDESPRIRAMAANHLIT